MSTVTVADWNGSRSLICLVVGRAERNKSTNFIGVGRVDGDSSMMLGVGRSRGFLTPATEVAFLMSIAQVLTDKGPCAAWIVASEDLLGIVIQLMAIEMFGSAIVAITASKGTVVAAFLAMLGPFSIVFELCNDFVLF
jgi:hypothetical protein